MGRSLGLPGPQATTILPNWHHGKPVSSQRGLIDGLAGLLIVALGDPSPDMDQIAGLQIPSQLGKTCGAALEEGGGVPVGALAQLAAVLVAPAVGGGDADFQDLAASEFGPAPDIALNLEFGMGIQTRRAHQP